MQFGATEGVFAAMKGGLYHTVDGREWNDLGVPEETVYGVGVSPSGDVIYAGTRPPYLYAASIPEDIRVFRSLQWQELCGFRDLTSRDEWGVPRHNNVAQVRDICVSSETPTRLIVGVEPGGVHGSRDGGKTWQERRDGVHDDIHALNVTSKGKCIVATGVGLYQTTDGGQSWHRLDVDVDQQYFRAVCRKDDTIYTSAACMPPNRWEESDAGPALFESPDGTALERVESPCNDEVVLGWTVEADAPLGVTHRGTLLRKDTKSWKVVGAVPSPDTLYGRFSNLTWYER